MTVTASAFTDPATSTSADDLFAMAYALRPQWAEDIAYSRGFSTDVRRALTATERRTPRLSRPTRTLTHQTQTITQEDAGQLSGWLSRASGGRMPIPIWPDLFSIASIDGTDLNSDTSLTGYEFEDGARVAIIRHRPGSAASTFIGIGLIASVGEFAITLTSPVPGAQAGDRCVPIMEAMPATQTRIDIRTGRITNSRAQWEEAIGKTAYSPRATPGATPSDFTEYAGYPVLPYFGDFRSTAAGWERDADYRNVGLGQRVTVRADRPRIRGRITLGFHGGSGRRFRRFFDSRAGRAYPFWFCDPTETLAPTSNPSTGTILAATSLTDYELQQIEAIYLVYPGDSEPTVRMVASASLTDGIATFTLEDALPSTFDPALIRRCGFAHLARFDSDELTERWQTHAINQTEIDIVGLIDEASIDLEIDSPIIGGTFGDPTICTPSMTPDAGPCVNACDEGMRFHFTDGLPEIVVEKTVWHFQDEGFGAASIQIGADPDWGGCALPADTYSATYRARPVNADWAGVIYFDRISTDLPEACDEDEFFPPTIPYTCPGEYEFDPSTGEKIATWPQAISPDPDTIRAYAGIYTSDYPLDYGYFNSMPAGWPFDPNYPGAGSPSNYYVLTDGGLPAGIDDDIERPAWSLSIYDLWTSGQIIVETATLTGPLSAGSCPSADGGCGCCTETLATQQASADDDTAFLTVGVGGCIRTPEGQCFQYVSCGSEVKVCGEIDMDDWFYDRPFTGCTLQRYDDNGGLYTLCGCLTKVGGWFDPLIAFGSVESWCCYLLTDIYESPDPDPLPDDCLESGTLSCPTP